MNATTARCYCNADVGERCICSGNKEWRDEVWSHLVGQPTPTDASLVEALVKIRHKVAGNKYKWIGHKCDAQVACDAADQIANHALAQHRAGNPWSDVVPTVPGWYWFLNAPNGTPDMWDVFNYDGNLSVRHTVMTSEGDNYSYRNVADMQGQWYGPLTPPEGI